MRKEEITAVFDQQASSYDRQWSRMAPVNGALHLLVEAVLSPLPQDARLLCVGAGTGAEILHLAAVFPGWTFTAVEPSMAMMEVLRRRAAEAGISGRCVFHEGYVDSLPPGGSFSAATAFLVSHFILDRAERAGFFRDIADRLLPGGILVSSDLSGDMADPRCRELLEAWFRVMAGGGVPAEGVARMREAYSRDVAVLPPEEVCGILMDGGFSAPVHFLQAGMIHAWYAGVRS